MPLQRRSLLLALSAGAALPLLQACGGGSDDKDTGTVVALAASDSRFSITAKHGIVDGNVIGTVNFVLGFSTNDYLELIWATSNVAAYIHAEVAQTSPFAHPSIPGIICTVVQVASD